MAMPDSAGWNLLSVIPSEVEESLASSLLNI